MPKARASGPVQIFVPEQCLPRGAIWPPPRLNRVKANHYLDVNSNLTAKTSTPFTEKQEGHHQEDYLTTQYSTKECYHQCQLKEAAPWDIFQIFMKFPKDIRGHNRGTYTRPRLKAQSQNDHTGSSFLRFGAIV